MANRILETLGILLIGDGVVGAAIPTRHSRRWMSGPEWWRHLMFLFAANPTVTRTLAVAEIAAGLWIVMRLDPR